MKQRKKTKKRKKSVNTKRIRKKPSQKPKKAWVLSVDMGYGHRRAAYPLNDIANGRIIVANNDKIISEKEKKTWRRAERFYNTISQLKSIPFIGKLFFGMYDNLQKISPFFPFRDLSKPTFTVLQLKKTINKGLCHSLLNFLNKEPLPIVSTHFIPALAADYLNYPGKIYCVVTDTDINRVWVADKPKESKIIYFAPCSHVMYRLKEYGVPEKNIVLTGFPLPKECIGGKDLSILKRSLGRRLVNLDPNNIYLKDYQQYIKSKIGKWYTRKSDHPLTLTYLIGGAGAQMDIGITIAKSLEKEIKKGEIVLNLVAGTRLDVLNYFKEHLEKEHLTSEIGKGINIIFALVKYEYFKKINQTLNKSDIIWTKPSEMSFYAALGLPIIIAPPVGAHEHYNQKWLQHVKTGFIQENPAYTHDWLFYHLKKGLFAESAMHAFKTHKYGTQRIEQIVLEKKPIESFQKDQIWKDFIEKGNSY